MEHIPTFLLREPDVILEIKSLPILSPSLDTHGWFTEKTYWAQAQGPMGSWGANHKKIENSHQLTTKTIKATTKRHKMTTETKTTKKRQRNDHRVTKSSRGDAKQAQL